MIHSALVSAPRIQVMNVPCDLCGSTETITIASGFDFEYLTCQNEFHVLTCGQCRLQFLNPRPTTESLDIIYPATYEPFHFNEIRNPVIRWARNFVQKKKVATLRKFVPSKASIIDVGCGSGSLLRLLKEFGSEGWSLTGNDFNESSLLPLRDIGIEIIPGRFEDIDTDRKFDVIILNQAIEHLESPSRIVAKAFSRLNPGGIIFIETPAVTGLDAKLFQKRYWGGYHFPRHWTLFDEPTLKHLLATHGFNVIHTGYIASPAFWIQSLHHYFLDHGFPDWIIHFWTIRNPLALSFFTALDSITAKFSLTSNIRIVAQKPL